MSDMHKLFAEHFGWAKRDGGLHTYENLRDFLNSWANGAYATSFPDSLKNQDWFDMDECMETCRTVLDECDCEQEIREGLEPFV